ncbi:MAG: PQQ-binding-like beta-propeller repeat protein [bacterium]|nr:PQQ-binding-like beta-propeller repeat protein [bacterium]
MNHLIQSIFIYFIFITLGFSTPITGIVFEDKNGNGIQDTGERGLANIGVSDGLEVVLTDANGKYVLANVDTTARVIFVTVPSGYSFQSSFYYLLDKPTTLNEFHFALQKVNGKPSDYFVQVTDIHIESTTSGADLKSAISELNQLNPPPGFIIATGDLVGNGSITTQFELYVESIKQNRFRWYNVFGNHDANDGEERALNYRYYLGPDYYSFDYGAYHFIVLNSVLTTARQQRWLENDLRVLEKNNPLIFFQHYPPQPGLRHNPLENIPNAKALFTGHWHSNKVFEENKRSYISTPPLRFGGIDASPAGYRIVSIKGNKITTEFRPLGKRLPIVSPVLIEDIRAVAQPTSDWRMFKQDASRNAVSENVILPPLGLCWKTKLVDARVMLSSPLVNDKILYLAVQNEKELGGRIIAFNAITGKILRSAKTRLTINHTPVLAQKTLFAIDIGGRIYAVAIPGMQLKWSYDLDDGLSHWIYSTPLVDNGKLYAGNAGKFVCLDAETGTLLWEKTYGSDWISSWATPSIANDTIYFGAVWNEQNCFALNAKTGEIIWSYKCNGLHTAPVPYQNKLYVADIAGKLAALDINNGKELWSFAMDKAWSLTTPTIANGLVIAASGKGTVYAVDAESGALRWQFRAGESLLRMSPYQANYATIFSSPVVSGKIVYLGGSDGNFYALDLLTGNRVWKQDFESPLLSTPAISGNTLYVVTLDGTIYAFCGR